MTWPLVLKMGHSVIGAAGDNYYFIWLIDWFKEALFDLHQSPFFCSLINFPEGYNLAYNVITPAMVMIALPFSLMAGPVFGYNVSLLLSFVLSGFGAYYFIFRLTGHRGGGLIAGTIFAFLPYRLAHMLGHLNLLGTQWLPLYFLFFHLALKNKEIRFKSILVPAIFLALIGFTSQYYLFMTLVISLLWLVFFLFIGEIRLLKDPRFWGKMAIFGGLVLGLVILTMLPSLQLSAQGKLPSHSIDEMSYWSASPTDFITPSPLHFLWGKWAESNFNMSKWIESTLYMGILALFLAGMAFLRKKTLAEHSKIIRILAFSAVIIMILALGTNLYWMGKPVSLNNIQIKLPGYFLAKNVPFYSNMRVWMRYGIFANLCIALLAGFGFILLTKKIKSTWRIPVTGFMIIFILFEFYQGSPGITRVRGRPVDYLLASQAKAGAVADFPFELAVTSKHMYYTSVHNKPYIGAIAAAYWPTQLKRIYPILEKFPDEKSVSLLRSLGVYYLIVDSTQYENMEAIEKKLDELSVNLGRIVGQHYVFLVE